MNNQNLEKLNIILEKRKAKLESVSNFYEYFDKFAYLHLKEVVRIIDNNLEKTNEELKVFFEDPYNKNDSRFFVMIQLFTQSFKRRRNSFILDNSDNFPLIKFDGDEFTGKVKATVQFGKRINKSTEYPIKDLHNDDKVFEIMLNFLETIYNL